MFCASVAYPTQQSGTFDFEYFANKHAPLFARYLGENCVRFEFIKSLVHLVLPPKFSWYCVLLGQVR